MKEGVSQHIKLEGGLLDTLVEYVNRLRDAILVREAGDECEMAKPGIDHPRNLLDIITLRRMRHALDPFHKAWKPCRQRCILATLDIGYHIGTQKNSVALRA